MGMGKRADQQTAKGMAHEKERSNEVSFAQQRVELSEYL
jgi:hypothetical protein